MYLLIVSKYYNELFYNNIFIDIVRQCSYVQAVSCNQPILHILMVMVIINYCVVDIIGVDSQKDCFIGTFFILNKR